VNTKLFSIEKSQFTRPGSQHRGAGRCCRQKFPGRDFSAVEGTTKGPWGSPIVRLAPTSSSHHQIALGRLLVSVLPSDTSEQRASTGKPPCRSGKPRRPLQFPRIVSTYIAAPPGAEVAFLPRPTGNS
jgi:hypothetical protein